MRKFVLGLAFGVVVGIIDLIPMILQNLTWDANLSAFLLWVVSGFLISVSNLKLKGPLKGLLISFMVLLPSAVLIGWKEPVSLVPIFIMTLILGSILGFLIEKYGK